MLSKATLCRPVGTIHEPEAMPDSSISCLEKLMKSLVTRAIRAVRDSRGATMAEYAILVAVIAIVVIVAAKALGNSISTKLNNSATSIASP
jgi:Flp pilus assembly pilin Flp